jgi:hypothetical protein
MTQQFEALIDCPPGKLFESSARGSHCTVYVIGCTESDLTDGLLGGRIDDVMSISAGGNQPFAVDIVFCAIVHVDFLSVSIFDEV